jgi:hypothetical protein
VDDTRSCSATSTTPAGLRTYCSRAWWSGRSAWQWWRSRIASQMRREALGTRSTRSPNSGPESRGIPPAQ